MPQPGAIFVFYCFSLVFIIHVNIFERQVLSPTPVALRLCYGVTDLFQMKNQHLMEGGDESRTPAVADKISASPMRFHQRDARYETGICSVTAPSARPIRLSPRRCQRRLEVVAPPRPILRTRRQKMEAGGPRRLRRIVLRMNSTR